MDRGKKSYVADHEKENVASRMSRLIAYGKKADAFKKREQK